MLNSVKGEATKLKTFLDTDSVRVCCLKGMSAQFKAAQTDDV